MIKEVEEERSRPGEAIVKGRTGQLFPLETRVSTTVLKGEADTNGKIRAYPRALNDCRWTLISLPEDF